MAALEQERAELPVSDGRRASAIDQELQVLQRRSIEMAAALPGLVVEAAPESADAVRHSREVHTPLAVASQGATGAVHAGLQQSLQRLAELEVG